MFKTKKFSEKLVKKPSEVVGDDFYEDDFENFVYDDDFIADNDGILATPSVSTTSVVSVTPETDSAGNNLNTKSSDLVDCELMSSLESEYGFEGEEEDTACSQNYDFRLFHEVLGEIPITKTKRFKNGTRSSLTFSNARVRQIERENQLLLVKIMKSGPAGDGLQKRSNSGSSIHQPPPLKSNAEVNRRKQQQKIEYENYLLKRKLDKIASRRPMPNTHG